MWTGRPLPLPGRGRRAAYGRGIDAYVMLLFVQLAQQIHQMENKPPVTLALMAANAGVYFRDLLPEPLQQLIPPLRRACLQPAAVLQGGQWSRLFWSAWVHADEGHLYYNLSSLLWKGARLERRLGPARFAALTAELLLLSHGLVVAGSWALAQAIPEYRGMYLSTCAVGFSAVLFAFKVVLNHDDPTYSSVMGFTLPTKYMAWAELVLASAFNPQASFFGHLCGILAGVVHVRGAAALRSGASGQRLLRRVAAAVARVVGGAHQPRFAGGGVSGRAAPRPPARPVQAQEPPERLPAARLPTSPVPGAMPAAAVGRQAPAVISMGSGHVTGGVAAVSEEELRQRRLARFQR